MNELEQAHKMVWDTFERGAVADRTWLILNAFKEIIYSRLPENFPNKLEYFNHELVRQRKEWKGI